jgi:hypothetical protein
MILARSVLGASALAFAATAGFAAGPVNMTTTLSGPAEVPPAPASGHGTAKISIDTAKGQLCYELTATGSDTPTMAHVHKGAAGVAGPVVVPLDAPGNGSSKGCATASADALAAILASPSDYYVNVHTAKYPKGAMRGQLGK